MAKFFDKQSMKLFTKFEWMIVENKTSGSNKNEAINALSSKIAFNKFFSNTQTDVVKKENWLGMQFQE